MAETFKPNFTLRTLPEIKAVLPRDYWRRYTRPVPKEVVRRLRAAGGGRAGSHVKVLAHGLGSKATMSEEIWLQIVKVVKPGKSFTGVVNTVTGRAQFHGLNFGMQISFEAKHIIDVGMIGT